MSDSLTIAIDLDRQLYSKSLPPNRFFSSLLLPFQIVLDLLGMLIGLIGIRLANPKTANALTAFIAQYKTHWNPQSFSSQTGQNINLTKKLIENFKTKTGKQPVVLLLSSHPKTSADESYLLGDLVYQGIQIITKIFPSSKFQLLQAIDGFALDTLPWYMGSLYAGAIAAGHLAVDRLPDSRNFTEKLIFRRTHYSSSAFRILKSLKNKKSVFVALSGGVVHNSRVLYVCKEWAQRIFFLGRRNKPKHWVEMQICSMLTGALSCACVTGKLSIMEKEKLQNFLDQAGIKDPERSRQIQELEEELTLNTPYRLRLFKILFQRLCSRKIPLLILPLKHTPEKKIIFSPGVLITDFNLKTGTTSVSSAGTLGDIVSRNYVDFIKEFVKKNLN